ncbi:thioredoxin domain-containing protein (plasmid) [Haloferacaceae archaeon DSL9]
MTTVDDLAQNGGDDSNDSNNSDGASEEGASETNNDSDSDYEGGDQETPQEDENSDEEDEGEQEADDDEEDGPTLQVSSPPRNYEDRPLPDDLGEYEYPVIGEADASTTATIYGNWKCPYTQDFAFGLFETIVEEYVEPGDLLIEFRMLSYREGSPFLGPDAPTAEHAALSIWENEPESYWSFFSYTFGNQPSSGQEWATAENLVALADAAGVEDTAQIESTIEDETYADQIDATTEAARTAGVYSVPRVVVDGSVHAPTIDPNGTIEALEDALDD